MVSHEDKLRCYFVWNPDAGHPHYQHHSFDSAKAEAKRLARENPDQSFIVLRAVGIARRETVAWAEVKNAGDDIPF